MGTLTINGIQVGFEDRLLEHLHIVITQRLRNGESFAMSWKNSTSVGDGRSSVWLHPYCEIHFRFEGGRVPAINGSWIETLTESAASSRGLIVVNEDGSLARAEGSRSPRRTGLSID